MEIGQARLAEAILYVAQHGAHDPTLGKTKLYKALFFADLKARSVLGATVTRWKYLRFKHGPVPLNARPLIDEMVSKGDLELIQMNYGPRTVHRLIAQRDADLSGFSRTEINFLDMGIGMACMGTADDASDRSHMTPAWLWSEADKLIDEDLFDYPYLVETKPAEGDVLKWALESAKAQGLA